MIKSVKIFSALLSIALSTLGLQTVFDTTASAAQEWQPEIVAPAADGAQPDGFSVPYAMTPDSRFVIFSSSSTNLVSGGAPVGQAYLRDRVTNVTELISVNSAGVPGNSGSHPDAISSNGRYVTFTSEANNLVAGDTNGNQDAFLRDRLLGTTERISLQANGSQIGQGGSAGPVSDDGNIALFNSTGSATAQTSVYNDGCTFIRNRAAHSTTDLLGATTKNGFPYPLPSQNNSMTSNGRYVAFSSHNLLPDDTNNNQQGYIVDTTTGTVTRLTSAPDGVVGNGNFNNGTLSPDGRFFAYTTAATNIDPLHPTSHLSTYVLDRNSGITENVGLGNNGPLNDDAVNVSINGDGRYVAFQSTATNVVSPSTPSGRALAYVRDRSTQTTTLVSRTSTGGIPDDHMNLDPYALSADGQHLLVYGIGRNIFPSPTVSNVQAVMYNSQPTDVDPPTIQANADRSPDSNGWYRSPVTVTFTCSDTGSSIASCPAPVVVNADGARQIVSGTATDTAGNSASTSIAIDVDQTAPTVTITGPEQGERYLVGHVPNASCQTSDALSGVATKASTTKTNNSDGTTTVVCDGAVDGAGNLGNVASLTYTVAPAMFNVATNTKGVSFNSSIDALVGASGVSVGDTISVAVATGPLTGAVGCTDTKGNVYSVVVDQNTLRGRLFVCSALATHALVAGDKVSATYAGFTGLSLISVNAVDVLASDGTIVATNRASGNSNTPASGTVTNQGSDVMFGVVAHNSTALFTPSSNFAVIGQVSSGSGIEHRTLIPEYQVMNSTQTLGAGGTLSSAQPWRSEVVDYLGGSLP